ncbi:MAG: hypothetical protein IJH77_03715, partial [Mogibacterium sp.]|nr:hypothetical protein [Mogibacterium sp.]
MEKIRNLWLLCLLLAMLVLPGCGSKDIGTEQSSQPAEEQSTESAVASSSEMAEVEDVVQDWMVPVTQGQIKDGTYDITVDSSSSMFRIDACVL